MTTENLNLGFTDIILIDYELGQGKIIISDTNWGYNFSYYWGAMGSTLKEFLCRINAGYFVKNLSTEDHGKINMKKTMAEVRKWWKKESGIHWWQYLDFQKELRWEFKRIESQSCSDENFIDMMNYLNSSLPLHKIANRLDREELEEAIKWLTAEPWNYIVYYESQQHIWLTNLHKKLKHTLENKEPEWMDEQYRGKFESHVRGVDY